MKNIFLTNYTEQTFLSRIKDDLRQCSAFKISVSFIKKAGLVLLIKDIEAALARGVKGEIITSTYQNFTDIESLRTFMVWMDKYPNFKCHLDFESFHDDGYMTIGYHSKGYYFEFDDEIELIVGSSNITRYALLKNVEWDLVIRDSRSNNVFHQMLFEFNDKWNGTYELDREIIAKYVSKLNFAIERWDMDYESTSENVNPNYMQRRAMKELNRYRAMGMRRALIVAAAGSGKTYLAAFDARNFNPDRLLYIVHEGSILQKALETFREVFGNEHTYGIYNKDCKELDADFVFAGNIILSQNLGLFNPHDFDYIIMDECHHATAESYKKIINYFQPEFMVGLTATPERMDNEDVFELFDTNVPYELRLRDAIINELVVPFHYYGIRDSLVDYGLNKSQERKMISQLATPEHCSFIREKIEEYRPAGKLKALAFCRNVTHASMMAAELEEQGYHTAYLTGKNTIGERIKAYNDLQNESADLEILCTVDILNEGVDIPGCNMVLFLRPTDSSTVFIQQLGRGLRKYDNKEYVTVLDFIGNSYKRSVQIAFAMGSLAENFVIEKRLMKSLVRDNFSALGLEKYGVEIHFDEESQKEIIESIDSENFNSKHYLEQDYYNFKKYINAEFPPKHMDYLNNDCAPDLMRFMQIKINNRKTECYYSFLQGIGEENLPVFSDEQIKYIKYVSRFLPLVRKHEYVLIQLLLDGPMMVDELRSSARGLIENCTDEELDHAIRFMVEKAAINYQEGLYALTVDIDDQLKEYLEDLIRYGITQYEIAYRNNEKFVLYHDYRIEQVQLKMLKNPGHIFKGTYFYGDDAFVFASLKKDASVEERLNYKDKFLEPKLFQWECENNISDNDLRALRMSKYVHLFIRKVENENGVQQPYIYVGDGHFNNERKQNKLDASTGKTNITYLYDIPMDEELPDYLQYDFGVANY
ncbi:PLD-like domain-containing protein [Pseudobutyrivibrio sp. JW11]|nr:PLD-like domain-containing protein [Pseudobutyrivibrio sp. JW11]